MAARAVVGSLLNPLVSGVTYRRGVHLLLGGVILLPYVLLGAAFRQMFTDGRTPRAVVVVLLAVTSLISAVPAFLRGTRMLEIAAARVLLDVDLPDPASTRLDLETRLRSALWFVVHLVAGGIVELALLVVLPMALILIAHRFGLGAEALAGLWLGPFNQHDTGWLTLIGLLLVIATIYLVAGLGALAAAMAPALLGPSRTERIAALEARASRLAERNRLARELHDSVGHALTVTTLQAGAAQEVIDRDPEFARRALRSIEEVSRAALADLDYVLGLLREPEPGRQRIPDRTPQRTLGDLKRLVADTRTGGLAVTIEVTGTIEVLPAAVSREGYRIVQEGLTNAIRHGRQPVTLRIDVLDTSLEIELINPVRERAGRGRRGRGLAGMRERVMLLGGRMSAGRDGDRWRVHVVLPIKAAAAGPTTADPAASAGTGPVVTTEMGPGNPGKGPTG